MDSSHKGPLSKSGLAYCQFDPNISMIFQSKLKYFHSRKYIWNCRLPKVDQFVFWYYKTDQFVSASMCSTKPTQSKAETKHLPEVVSWFSPNVFIDLSDNPLPCRPNLAIPTAVTTACRLVSSCISPRYPWLVRVCGPRRSCLRMCGLDLMKEWKFLMGRLHASPDMHGW